MQKLRIELRATKRPRSGELFRGRDGRGRTLAMNSLHLLRDGRPWLPAMGEFHYARYPHELWEQELKKIKAGGIEIVPSYIFWNHHEEEEGVFDFAGRRNLRRFVELCGKVGLWSLVRIGPFCHGEVRNGGLPDWLYGRGFELRCDDPKYLACVRRLYQQIGKQLKGLMFKDGGPVIGVQCENEFMDSVAPWETTHNSGMDYTPRGTGGAKHLMTLKRLARSAGLDVPLYTTTAWGDSPVDPRQFLPMYGGYGYYAWVDDPSQQPPTGFFLFRDARRQNQAKYDSTGVPFACCEIGGGMQVYYKNRPVVPPESVEAMHVVQLGSGSNLMGFYVYHGGSNPVGRKGYLNEYRCPRISYDYQAPLGEYGQVRPHYGRLRRQFLLLQSFGERLAPMETSVTAEVAGMQPADTQTVRWAVRSDGRAGFLFLSNFQDHVEMPEQRDLVFNIRTGSGELLTVPASGRGLTLCSGQSAILPFNFEMDGLLLKSATLQPLTRIEVDGVPHYFFFAPKGISPEYAMESSNIRQMDLTAARSRQLSELVLIDPVPGTNNLITLTLNSGQRVRITTLTEEQSTQFWRTDVAGRSRVFLSAAQLMFNGRTVQLRQTSEPRMRLGVYPPLSDGSASRRDGLFQMHSVRVKRKSIRPLVRPISPGKLAVRIPANALKDAGEVYLQIDYIGDTGSAYLDGTLIHDNFWNGSTWEIALRPFAPKILERELVLVLTPLQKGEGPKVHCSSMAAMRVIGNGRMEFRSIRAVVEYAATIRLASKKRGRP